MSEREETHCWPNESGGESLVWREGPIAFYLHDDALGDGSPRQVPLDLANEFLRLASEVATLRKERDEAREVALDLIHLAADAAERRNGDWACAECRPHSDMLKEGWSCGYHRALALRARIASREGEK